MNGYEQSDFPAFKYAIWQSIIQEHKAVIERHKAEALDFSGYVYLIRYDGYTKIGHSINKQRLTDILFALPPKDDVKCIYYRAIDRRESEAFLHKLFHKKRVNGEWFHLDDQDHETIRHYFEQ